MNIGNSYKYTLDELKIFIYHCETNNFENVTVTGFDNGCIFLDDGARSVEIMEFVNPKPIAMAEPCKQTKFITKKEAFNEFSLYVKEGDFFIVDNQEYFVA